MPPKTRGHSKATKDGNTGSNSGFSAARSVISTPARRKEKGRTTPLRTAVPDVFRDLLTETLSSHDIDAPDVPRKRRKVRTADNETLHNDQAVMKENSVHDADDDDDEEMSLDFEDVLLPKTEQTAYNDSGSDDSDSDWEGLGQAGTVLAGKAQDDGDLVLTLNAEETTPRRKSVAARRKAITKADRALRLEIHKMNLLCLLRFVDRRNGWCNDKLVQDTLRPLLTKKIIGYLKPKENNTQFGKAESVKKGLTQISDMWEAKFNITARGMRRPFWAMDERELMNVSFAFLT